jgi:hypothetical protein
MTAAPDEFKNFYREGYRNGYQHGYFMQPEPHGKKIVQ